MMTVAPLSDAPSWLLDWFAAAAAERADRRHGSFDGDWDQPSDIAEAERRIALNLDQEGTPAEGQGSDERAYRIATWLLDLPLNEETIAALLHERWAPHFDPAWLARKVRNAAGYRQNDAGCEHVATASEIYSMWCLEHPEATPPPLVVQQPAKRFGLIGIDEMRQAPPLTFYDHRRLLPQYADGGVVMLYGPPGAHKTNILLSLLLDAVTERPELRVRYAAGEGIQGLGARFRAQYRARGLDAGAIPADRFALVPMPHLADQNDMATFAAFLAGQPPHILVVDTFATGLMGAEEDQRAAHLLTMTGALGQLAAKFHCLAIVVHHTGWDEKHMRGASGFYANAGGVLRADANAPRAATYCKLFAERFRDGPDGHSAYFALQRDGAEGVPVPVQCTEQEWELFAGDEKKREERLAATLAFEAIESKLKTMMAFGPDKGKPAIQIAAHMIERRSLSEKEYGDACKRIADLLEKRATKDLGGLNQITDRGRLWFVPTA